VEVETGLWATEPGGYRLAVEAAVVKHPVSSILARICLALALVAVPSARVLGEVNHVTSATITVKTDRSAGVINPCIYGHFTEHLGGVIYDGIWVGKGSKIPNIDGIRKDIVDYVRRIKPAVIRWPGGCFADAYHWKDGIGPATERPKRYNRWTDVAETNQFGTHEFIEFCKLVGAEPCFAANVGTGTAQEFQEWMDYCNAPTGQTTLADLREKNGSREPLNVKYWGVGNEAWGCGGGFTPEDYCTEYRKFTVMLPAYGKQLFLIGSGPHDNDLEWTRRFFAKLAQCVADWGRAPINGWAPHYYCGSAGEAVKFNEDQWYELIAKAAEMEKLVTDQWAVLGEFDPKHNVKLVVDEWGTWHPGGTEINKAHVLEQMSTLRDAMVAAVTLDIFNRHCDKVAMSNIAQLVNNLQSLFLADGPKFVATPNFYVYEMYKVHQGAKEVELEVKSPDAEYKIGENKRTFAVLRGSASIKDRKLHISIVNSSTKNAVEASIDLGGATVSGARQTVLTNKDIHAHNTFEHPDEVVSVSTSLQVSGSAFKHVFPPASITMLEFDLK
jgi:alpha-L-arabinofuranosidase